MGENAKIEYSITEGDGSDIFGIITDKDTQEGIITVKKVHILINFGCVYKPLLGCNKPYVMYSLYWILHRCRLHMTYKESPPHALHKAYFTR